MEYTANISHLAWLYVIAESPAKELLARAGAIMFGPAKWEEAATYAEKVSEKDQILSRQRLHAAAERAEFREGLERRGQHRRPFTTIEDGGPERPAFQVLWMPADGEALWTKAWHEGRTFMSDRATDQEALAAFDAGGKPFTLPTLST